MKEITFPQNCPRKFPLQQLYIFLFYMFYIFIFVCWTIFPEIFWEESIDCNHLRFFAKCQNLCGRTFYWPFLPSHISSLKNTINFFQFSNICAEIIFFLIWPVIKLHPSFKWCSFFYPIMIPLICISEIPLRWTLCSQLIFSWLI
jgi:hypothetical protein